MTSQPDTEEPPCCPACGQRIRPLYPHRIGRQSVAVLEAIAKLNQRGHTWVRVDAGREVSAGPDCIRTAYRAGAHAIYLSWFGLVELEHYRSGNFRVTPKGYDFLTGRASVPAIIYCRGGRVERTDPRSVWISEIDRVYFDKDYWDNYAATLGRSAEQQELFAQP